MCKVIDDFSELNIQTAKLEAMVLHYADTA
jgi:hypothetical protein